jgi:hypothetical protein
MRRALLLALAAAHARSVDNKYAAVARLLRDYATKHGRGAATGAYAARRRTYVLGVYSCPEQAGNRLHEFLNAYAVAVVTDRTLVWKFCHFKRCPKENTEARCGAALARKPWLLSVAAVGGLRSEDARRAPGWPARPTEADVRARAGALERPAAPLLDVGVMEHREAAALNAAALSPPARRRARALFGAGVDVAYGALLESAFSFVAAPRDPVPRGAASFAVHSRHQRASDAGGNVEKEATCLATLVETPCVVFLMSDRQRSLDLLAERAAALGCRSVVANRAASPASGEHGPVAGAGFFADLASASRARDGVVVNVRGSSAGELLREAAAARAAAAGLPPPRVCVA